MKLVPGNFYMSCHAHYPTICKPLIIVNKLTEKLEATMLLIHSGESWHLFCANAQARLRSSTILERMHDTIAFKPPSFQATPLVSQGGGPSP